MKKLVLIAAMALISNPPAHAASGAYGGTITVAVSGNFKNYVSPGVIVACTATVFLVPAINGATNLGNFAPALLLTGGLGRESASAQATLANGSAFSCTPTVQYRWDNIDPALTQMIVVYKVSAQDPGYLNIYCAQNGGSNCYTPGGNPGSKQQVIGVLPIPASGATTTYSANPKL